MVRSGTDQPFTGVPIQKKDEFGLGKEEELNQASLKKAQEEEERKLKLKTTVTKLYKQTKEGCMKDICFNQNCQKNPLCKDFVHI